MELIELGNKVSGWRCSSNMMVVVRLIDQGGGGLFDGWVGRVKVGWIKEDEYFWSIDRFLNKTGSSDTYLLKVWDCATHLTKA